MIKLWMLLFIWDGEMSHQPQPVADYAVYPIRVNHPFEPSGLTIKNERLYTICDDSNQIYALTVNDTDATARAELAIDRESLGVESLDLEAITAVGDDFFVVSEVHHRMIKVNQLGSQWVPAADSIYQPAFAAGLFQVHNAGMEALVHLGGQRFLLAVERQPRGLIDVTFDEQFQTITQQINQVYDNSDHPLQGARKPDFTGLYLHGGTLYALHRNAYVVHELIQDEHGNYREGRAWSYEHIVKSFDHSYQDMSFGQAEGLAVDDDHFYLVIDNNNQPKLKNPNDNSPLLIKIKRK
ncbi:SdiA-regulated domain-containing protein [Marinicella meishanensis]|uniref:SdiA-regulated domain-containing protein n=1 Tax=Marinicella meishanensis TaxID=2873263 RepID=UPI001CC10513|nr:SdiA-regulated domain-containing protein [Marinicella sp. NBU2979]